MEWTENKTKLLIEEVEKHPCLYNCKLDEYHNRDLRTVSWQRVAEACGSTGMILASKSRYFVVNLLWQFIAYAIVQLLKQFYCARKLRHKLPQFIAVCVMDLMDAESDDSVKDD